MPGLSDGQELSRISVRAVVNAMVVAAGVIERDGRFLVTQRQAGVHLEGFWEFPGGKCEAGETLDSCLTRELQEELGVDAHIGEEVCKTLHEYADRSVELHFLKCELLGEPKPQLGQAMSWVAREELASLSFPSADLELIRILTQGRERQTERKK